MTYLVLFFCLVAATILQALLPAWHYMGQAKPPLLLAVLLYYMLSRERGVMLTAALCAGLMQDALGLTPLGYSSFCYCLIGLALERFKDKIFGHQWMTHLLLGALTSFGFTALIYFMLISSGTLVMPFYSMLIKAIGTALLAVLVMPLCFRAVRHLEVKVGNIHLQDL